MWATNVRFADKLLPLRVCECLNKGIRESIPQIRIIGIPGPASNKRLVPIDPLLYSIRQIVEGPNLNSILLRILVSFVKPLLRVLSSTNNYGVAKVQAPDRPE